MKKKVCILVFNLIFVSIVFALNPSIIKTFIINGETVTEVVKLSIHREYDEYGNTTYFSIPSFYPEAYTEYKYNDVNKKIESTTNGDTTYYFYDLENRIIEEKTNKSKWLYEYNETGYTKKCFDLQGNITCEYTYDNFNNPISYINNGDVEFFCKYDINGFKTYQWVKGGYEEYYKNNEKGDPIEIKDQSNTIVYVDYKYDQFGNILYKKKYIRNNPKSDYEEWYTYNDKNDVVYFTNSFNAHIYYEYEYWPNGKKRKEINYSKN